MPESSLHTILMFRTHGRLLAVPLDAVREVVPAFEVLHAPGLASTIAGMISLRGEVLPVIDTAVLIGEEVTLLQPQHKFIIVRASRQSIAFLVDSVEDLVALEQNASVDPMAGNGAVLFKGVVSVEEEMVLILDIDACYGAELTLLPLEVNGAKTKLEGQYS
ncbi:MAG: purine-binding chemotaxis protein CheW [Bacteroidetes bacterium]|nr:purine-binding chemotaxis protein CheW [Bacteroidota bacterium]